MKVSDIKTKTLADELRRRGYKVDDRIPKRKYKDREAQKGKMVARYAIRMEAYHLAEDDVEAADILQMNVDTFKVWRRARGLTEKGKGSSV